MDSTTSVLLVLLVCSLSVSFKNRVEGGRRFLSKEEDTELDKQLKLLNKPSFKSIRTKYGDLYNCVDFYNQPAFDHPSLKNHTFHPQMKPFVIPKLMRDKELSKARNKASDIGLKGLSCPPGTVPVKKFTKDDLIREKLYLERYDSTYSVLTVDNPGTHYAMVQTTFDPNKKYNGGGANIVTFNPSVISSQFSSARIRIKNALESIQVGWTVNPTLYGDNRTRTYTYLNAGQSRCFNTRCPGFVIVDTQISLGAVLDVSQKGGELSEEKFSIYRDEPVGNWWLVIGDDNRRIGFWPQRIFTSLADLATSIEWGGEVFSPPDVPSPQMGSGDFPSLDLRFNAFCYNITTINEAHEVVAPEKTEEYRDINRYEIRDEGKIGKLNLGHVVVFGGPGGATGN